MLVALQRSAHACLHDRSILDHLLVQAHRAASSIDDSVMQYEKVGLLYRHRLYTCSGKGPAALVRQFWSLFRRHQVAYSYAEEAAYLTILYLFAGIVWFLMRYANRSLFKWHTVSEGLFITVLALMHLIRHFLVYAAGSATVD
jgi:hypothetical protein